MLQVRSRLLVVSASFGYAEWSKGGSHESLALEPWSIARILKCTEVQQKITEVQHQKTCEFSQCVCQLSLVVWPKVRSFCFLNGAAASTVDLVMLSRASCFTIHHRVWSASYPPSLISCPNKDRIAAPCSFQQFLESLLSLLQLVYQHCITLIFAQTRILVQVLSMLYHAFLLSLNLIFQSGPTRANL